MIKPLTLDRLQEAAEFSAARAEAAGYTVSDKDKWWSILMQHCLGDRGFIALEDGKLVGVAIYGLAHTAEGAFREGYNPAQKEGQVIWCPFLAATGPGHILGMIRAAAACHPQATTLAYRRRRVHLVKISLRRTRHGWKSSVGRYGHGQVPAGSCAGS